MSNVYGDLFRQYILEPKNLSITEAAKQLGITRDTLSAWIRGKSGTSNKMAASLKEHYGFDVNIEPENFNGTCLPEWGLVNCGTVFNVDNDEDGYINFFISYIITFENLMTKFGRNIVAIHGNIESEEDIEFVEKYILENHCDNNPRIKVILINYQKV